MDFMMTLDQVMDHAADIIDERGWCQYTYSKASGEVCCLSALQLASPGWEEQQAAFTFIMDRLGGNISGWNDSKCNSLFEATEMFRSMGKWYRELNQE